MGHGLSSPLVLVFCLLITLGFFQEAPCSVPCLLSLGPVSKIHLFFSRATPPSPLVATSEWHLIQEYETQSVFFKDDI